MWYPWGHCMGSPCWACPSGAHLCANSAPYNRAGTQVGFARAAQVGHAHALPKWDPRGYFVGSLSCCALALPITALTSPSHICNAHGNISPFDVILSYILFYRTHSNWSWNRSRKCLNSVMTQNIFKKLLANRWKWGQVWSTIVPFITWSIFSVCASKTFAVVWPLAETLNLCIQKSVCNDMELHTVLFMISGILILFNKEEN